MRYGAAIFALIATAVAMGMTTSRRPPAPSGLIATVNPRIATIAEHGRLIFFVSPTPKPEPRDADPTTSPEPVFGIDVTGIEPGKSFDLTQADLDAARSGARGFLGPIGDIDPQWYVQAVLDIDRSTRSFNADGNLYSEPMRVGDAIDEAGRVSVTLDRLVCDPEVRVRRIALRSRLLSAFHGRDVHLRAAVVEPHGYAGNDSTYPVLYRIPGLFGRHTDAIRWLSSGEGRASCSGAWPLRAVNVFLDPDVPFGHSTFANSDNNGPVADALLSELIPYIEQQYRIDTDARFLTGHSSGGWASLWLQVQYPEAFAGTWSTAPDPVDFRSLQLIDIYAMENAYYDDADDQRPSVRRDGDVVVTIRDEFQFERATGPGNQWGSWFAVFGSRGADGSPKPLWNPDTGEIDRVEAARWRQYDIRLLLESRPELADELREKIHVVAAGEDTYYLDTAVEQLQELFGARGGVRTTDGVVQMPGGGYIEVLGGHDHSSFLSVELSRRFATEMAAVAAHRP